VLEAARNVACVGAEPLGLTDCLNFGNPEKPEIGWELTEVIEGMAEAAEALGLPIVSGNVSLYNDTSGRSIQPTPVVGCVGLVPDVRQVPTGWREGDVILLAAAGAVSLAGSEYQARYGTVSGAPGALDLELEARLVSVACDAGRSCTLVHDVAEGGLAIALAEAALWSGVGATFDLPDDPAALFGEGPGQVIVAAEPAVAVEDELVRRIGVVGGDTIFGLPLADLRRAWKGER
jgi:phosphoribosylformylglycinamidine synthase